MERTQDRIVFQARTHHMRTRADQTLDEGVQGIGGVGGKTDPSVLACPEETGRFCSERPRPLSPIPRPDHSRPGRERHRVRDSAPGPVAGNRRSSGRKLRHCRDRSSHPPCPNQLQVLGLGSPASRLAPFLMPPGKRASSSNRLISVPFRSWLFSGARPLAA